MTIFHDEIEIEDFEFEEDDEMYYYPCPCGDRFQISKLLLPNPPKSEELMAGEEVATCPSCSLVVKVIYDLEKFKAEAQELHKEDGDKETVKA